MTPLSQLPLFPAPAECTDGPSVPRSEGPLTLRLRGAENGAGQTEAAVTRLARRCIPARPAEDGAFLDIRIEEGNTPVAAQTYTLRIADGGTTLTAGGEAGLRYGLDTLAAVLAAAPEDGPLPGGTIEDAPAVAVRGWMLDISRCRVPTRETLAALVDAMEDLRLNQLQLYTEHTFAYRGHERVWGDASPLTVENCAWLDALCAERGIELVPNQNSFGHFERWLRYPEYKHLAECPDGFIHPAGLRFPYATTLCPGPEARRFVASLYDKLLPCFRSPLFNIGGDEPWELGQGRSRARAEADGKLAIYLDFLRGLTEEAAERGRTPMFWADVFLEEGGATHALPPGAVPLIWGYEADHPFDEQAGKLARSGRGFYLCPGTACWNSVGGRMHTARANLANAVANARKHGAAGLLLTTWGDGGHHQPYAATLPALAHGAGLAWNPETDPADGGGRFLQRLFRGDEAVRAAHALVALGEIAGGFRHQLSNGSPLDKVLFANAGDLPRHVDPLDPGELENAAAKLRDIETALTGATPRRLGHGADVAAALLAFAVDRARAWKTGRANLEAPALSARLNRLIGRHEEAWLQTSRIGGLHESSARLRKVLAAL
ncbi:MAG: family 20 glycosylhydrolase [Opitutales bacterium]|nr:family 20 glycosylhydrolase [Opitutales bacterium]